MLVSLSSVRGSPGVSSWSLLLAAAWPDGAGDRVVLEADADGGVFASRYGLGVEPGVARLVSLARRHEGGFPVDEVARRVAERVWVIPGPESAEAASVVWGAAVDEVASMAARDERVWLVDCGRLNAGSWARPFAARSVLSVVLCRGRADELVAVPARLAGLHRAGASSVGVIVVGQCDYPLDVLREHFSTGLVWAVRETKDVSSLAHLVLSQRRARRHWAWREALGVAGSMAERLTPGASLAAELGAVAGDE